jgi:DNA invertase Pin-like site-specific DNA recombinase
MTTDRPLHAALYARVSTTDQTTENQILELRRYIEARGWTGTEYLDTISGTKECRPALDRLMADARRRRFDVLVVWRLDRLGRSLKHLIVTLDELAALGIGFTSLNEGIDTATPAGKLQLHLLAAIAEFERGRIVERVRAGLARARKDGKRLGRRPRRIADHDLERTAHLSIRDAAKILDVPRSVLHRARLSRNPSESAPTFAQVSEAESDVLSLTRRTVLEGH